MIKILFTIIYLGSNIFWGLGMYGQQIKVTYEASAKQLSNPNQKTNKVMGEIARRVNNILPYIDFVVIANNKIHNFHNEPHMTSDFDGSISLLNLALSISMDGKQIFGDYSNNIAYYEPTITSKIKSVKMDNVEWTITKESKIILGYTCYKAIAKIIDLEEEDKLTVPIVAWFCPTLSLHGGPTAYATLPGMILEFENGKVKFIAKKVEEKKGLKIEIPNYKPKSILPHKEWNAYFSANNPVSKLRN